MMHMSSTLVFFAVLLVGLVAGSLVLLRGFGGRKLDD